MHQIIFPEQWLNYTPQYTSYLHISQEAWLTKQKRIANAI